MRRMQPILDRIAGSMARRGMGYSFVHLLGVAGRHTGEMHEVPVAVVSDGPRRWLVAQVPTSAWVANVRASGQGTLTRGKVIQEVSLTEVSDRERAGDVIGRYRRMTAGMTKRHFPSENDLEEAGRHPVFALNPLDADIAAETPSVGRTATSGESS